MTRLIDADALKKHLHNDPLYPLVEKYGMDRVIDAQPTVDAVPIIRCKDCKNEDTCLVTQIFLLGEYGYCASAKPKENHENI